MSLYADKLTFGSVTSVDALTTASNGSQQDALASTAGTRPDSLTASPKSLYANSDWIDTDEDGLADGFIPGDGIYSIVTLPGSGAAQKMETADVEAASLLLSLPLVPLNIYRVEFNYESNEEVLFTFAGTTETLPVAAEISTIKRNILAATDTAFPSIIIWGIEPSDGKYFIIDDLTITQLTKDDLTLS